MIATMIVPPGQQGQVLEVWSTLLTSWRGRVLKAIRVARKTYPMEEGVLDGLRALLEETPPG